MSFVSSSSNILLLKKIGMLTMIEKVQQNYLFITILFNIKFTIKFSLSLSLYIYIYIYDWLRHPIIFNISFVLSPSHVRPYTFLEERKVSLIFALMMVLMDVINPKITWVGVYE